MQLIKCKNGHVYDSDKLKNCPHCQGIVKNLDVLADTYGKNQSDIPTEVSESKGRLNQRELGMRKTVGILVETKGNSTGKSYVLYEGTNTMGRAGNLEVSLEDEKTVSRTGHAEICYEDGVFEISPTKPDRMVFVNGKQIKGQVVINDRDVIEIGDCTFSFIKYDDVY